jgi:hypothetical protein
MGTVKPMFMFPEESAVVAATYVDAKLIVTKLPDPNPEPVTVTGLPTFPEVALSDIDTAPEGKLVPEFVPGVVLVPVLEEIPVLVPVPGAGVVPFAVTVNVADAEPPVDAVAVTV